MPGTLGSTESCSGHYPSKFGKDLNRIWGYSCCCPQFLLVPHRAMYPGYINKLTTLPQTQALVRELLAVRYILSVLWLICKKCTEWTHIGNASTVRPS